MCVRECECACECVCACVRECECVCAYVCVRVCVGQPNKLLTTGSRLTLLCLFVTAAHQLAMGEKLEQVHSLFDEGKNTHNTKTGSGRDVSSAQKRAAFMEQGY